MSPLTAVLPDAAMRLWTAVVAADSDVSTGILDAGGTGGGSVVDGNPFDESIGSEEQQLV